MRFRTRFSDEEIVQALWALAQAGAGRDDAPDRLTPPNLCVFFNNLPRPERDRLLDLVYPRPAPASKASRAPRKPAVGLRAQRAAAAAPPAPLAGAMPLTIRPATVADLPAVLDVDRTCFGSAPGLAFGPYTLRQFLDLAQDGFLVAIHGEEVVGFAIGAPAADRRSAWVLALGVEPSARRQGVGLALSHGLLERLRRKGAERVSLTVEPGNTAALALYRQLGFKEVETAPDYFGRGQSRVVMRA